MVWINRKSYPYQIAGSKIRWYRITKEEADEFTSVTIDNFYPGYQIDYKTGKATPYSDATTNNRDTLTADRDESDTTGVIEGDKLKELQDNAKSIGDSVKTKEKKLKVTLRKV